MLGRLGNQIHIYIFCGVFSTQSYGIRIIIKKIYLIHSWNPNRYCHLVRENLEVIAVKEYSTLPNSLKLEPHHQLHVIFSRGWGFTILQGIQSVYSKSYKQDGFIIKILYMLSKNWLKKKKSKTETKHVYLSTFLSAINKLFWSDFFLLFFSSWTISCVNISLSVKKTELFNTFL